MIVSQNSSVTHTLSRVRLGLHWHGIAICKDLVAEQLAVVNVSDFWAVDLLVKEGAALFGRPMNPHRVIVAVTSPTLKIRVFAKNPAAGIAAIVIFPARANH